jgi:hypothetical protein
MLAWKNLERSEMQNKVESILRSIHFAGKPKESKLPMFNK